MDNITFNIRGENGIMWETYTRYIHSEVVQLYKKSEVNTIMGVTFR